MANISSVSICNIALGNIGASPITNAEFQEQSSKAAGLCNRLYEPLRDAVLEAHEWSFACKRERLARMAETPAFGWSAQFLVPNSCVRMLYVSDQMTYNQDTQIEWEAEDGMIFCNAEQLYVRYLRTVTDPNKFSPTFVQALAARLSMDLAMPITNSATMVQTMASLYQAKMDEAKILDGMQGRKRRTATSVLVSAHGSQGLSTR